MTERHPGFGEFKPTPELRFVIGYIPAPEMGEGISKSARILQQKWEAGEIAWQGQRRFIHEWRDVPLVEV